MLIKKNGRHYNTRVYPDVYQRMQERELQIKKWNKEKDKHYYQVTMFNGGKKYVCMCEEMVKDLYGWSGYKRV